MVEEISNQQHFNNFFLSLVEVSLKLSFIIYTVHLPLFAVIIVLIISIVIVIIIIIIISIYFQLVIGYFLNVLLFEFERQIILTHLFPMHLFPILKTSENLTAF